MFFYSNHRNCNFLYVSLTGENELLAQKAPPMPQMEAQTAEELEANIKHLVGIQREEKQQPQQPQPEGEMSAFKKFVSSFN